MGEAPHWGRFWEHQELTTAETALLLRARERARAALIAYGARPDNFGLIHADLHPENIVYNGKDLALIDFDDSAYGWHMYEITSTLIEDRFDPDFDALRAALLEGYREHRPLAERDVDMLSVFLLIRGMAIIGWFHQRPEHAGSSFFAEVMEQNYHTARAGRMPEEPRLDIVIPSTLDDSLAPQGHHVMSILCKYYPYEPADNQHWDDIRDRIADDIVDYLSRHMPNIKSLIVGRQVLTPLDLERVFGLTEGDIFHGRHDLDQIFSLRPHPSAAKYRTPLKGLYLCGSGSHPGGAVSGALGHNGALRVIKDLR